MAPVIRRLRDAEWATCDLITTGQHNGLLSQGLADFGLTADFSIPHETGQQEPRGDARVARRQARCAVRSDQAELRNRAGRHDVGARGIACGILPADSLRPCRSGFADTRYVGAIPGGIPSPLDRGGDLPALRADHGGGRASAKRKYPDRAHSDLRQYGDRCAARDRGRKSAAAAPIFRTSPVRSCSPRIGAKIATDGCATRSRASANLSTRMTTPPSSFPVHVNPAARSIAHEMLSDHPRIVLAEPVSYREIVGAMQRSWLVLTDSGGLQEEAPALGQAGFRAARRHRAPGSGRSRRRSRHRHVRRSGVRAR